MVADILRKNDRVSSALASLPLLKQPYTLSFLLFLQIKVNKDRSFIISSNYLNLLAPSGALILNSHPNLLLIHPLFQIKPVLNTGLSLSEPLQLYKGYNALSRAIDGLNVLASWMPQGFDWASIMMTWGHLGHYLGTTWG